MVEVQHQPLFEVTEASTFASGYSGPIHQAICALIGLYPSKGKTAIFIPVLAMLWEWLKILECYGNSFLTSTWDKIKNGPYVQEFLDAILLHAALGILKVPGNSTLPPEAKGNHLTDISVKNASLKVSKSQTSIMV